MDYINRESMNYHSKIISIANARAFGGRFIYFILVRGFLISSGKLST